MAEETSGRWGLTAKQAPHRPGTAPAPGLRAEVVSHPFDRRPTRFRRLTVSIRSPFRRLRSRSLGRPHRPPASPRLRVDPLDDRCLPSTFTVTNLLDSGAGSLRAAVAAANA